jgi:hypothetical protein
MKNRGNSSPEQFFNVDRILVPLKRENFKEHLLFFDAKRSAKYNSKTFCEEFFRIMLLQGVFIYA